MSDPEQKPSKTDEEFKKIPLYKVLEKEYEEIHGDLHNSYIDEIGLLTFCEDEFKPPLTIKKLCEAIGKDTIEKIPTNTCDNLINRLNVLLGMPDFYNNLHNKKPDIIFSKDVMELVANTKECREKVSESLDGKEKLKLKKLNRLLLEEAYPQETPKYQKKGISEIYKRIHNLESKRSALCLSGGGIRSAAFALGVIQCLARYKLLDKFDYLSTVSGGGYIGSWLTAWIQNHEQGLAGVAEELENVPKSQLDHEPKPIKHLRSYTNYLTPKLGIMSADVWTLVATYLRNLLLNWFLFIPLLLAALIIPRFCVTVVLSQPHSFLIPFTLGVGSVAVVFAIYYIGVNCPGSSSKNNRDQKLFLPMCLLPLIISAVSLTTYWAWYSKEGTLSIWHFIGFGAMLHLIGWLAYSVRLCQFSGKESFVVLLTGALGGLFAWLMATSLFPDINMFAGHYVCFAAPSFLGLFLITGVLLVGFLGRYFEDKDLEWLARFGAWVLIAITIWSAVSSLVIFGPVGLLKLWEKVPTLIASLGGISGIITLFFSFSSKTPFGRKQKENNGLISALINNVLIISASIFIVFLIMLLSLGTDPIVRLVNNKLSTKIFQTKIIDRSDFWSGEFTSEATIEKLCDTINKDLYPISTENTIQSVKELNDLLTLEAFYGIITEKKRDIKFSDEITELVYKIKKDSYKNDPNLNDDKKSNIKRLNRLLLEEAYPQKTPKSRNPYSHIGLIFNNPLITLVILFLGLVVIVAIMCIPIDINKFSLHSIYQNRLIRAFIGASRHNRNPNLFTGFDENDNLKMHTLRCRHKCRYENSCEYRKDKLFHVVNIALNLVKGDNPAWQERKAASFTITPLFSGCSNIPSVGYRNSEKYGGEDGISLGTAITVSGAAVSPNMGYHSSPVLSFLLTLFNIRLGLWMGNPADDTTFKKQGPILSLRPIISEAFGLTNEKKPYVYLSDGGHFENLGLYEMILRRCHFIVLVDAGCDEDHTFGDLGNALRKIRIDLGVPIVFKNIAIYPRKDEREDGKHCAIGNILYSKVDEKDTDGKLIYIKPTLCGDELIDIGSYAKANPEFPHESTGDQWFTESQFESYRALGSHAIYQICENTKTLTNLKDLFEQAEKYAIVSPKSPTENTTRVVITTSKT